MYNAIEVLQAVVLAIPSVDLSNNTVADLDLFVDVGNVAVLDSTHLNPNVYAPFLNLVVATILYTGLLLVLVRIFLNLTNTLHNNYTLVHSALSILSLASSINSNNVYDEYYTATLFLTWVVSLLVGGALTQTLDTAMVVNIWPVALVAVTYVPLLCVVVIPSYCMVYQLFGYRVHNNIINSTFDDSLLVFSLFTSFALQGLSFLFVSFLFTNLSFHLAEYPLVTYSVSGITPPDFSKFDATVIWTYLHLAIDILELVFVVIFQFTVFFILLFFVFWSFVNVPGSTLLNKSRN